MALCLGKLFLDVLPLFVVELIDGLHRFAGHQAGNKASFIRGQGSEDVDPRIKCDEQLRIKTLGPLFLGLIDHFEHIVIGFGDQTNLAHRGGPLLRFPNASKLAHRDLPPAQFGFPDAAEFKDQQIPPPRFVQVVGQPRSSRKLVWALPIDVHGRKKGLPGLVQLQEHLISHLGGERLIGLRLFDQMKDAPCY